jgi:hypothetical protein
MTFNGKRCGVKKISTNVSASFFNQGKILSHNRKPLQLADAAG